MRTDSGLRARQPVSPQVVTVDRFREVGLRGSSSLAVQAPRVQYGHPSPPCVRLAVQPLNIRRFLGCSAEGEFGDPPFGDGNPESEGSSPTLDDHPLPRLLRARYVSIEAASEDLSDIGVYGAPKRRSRQVQLFDDLVHRVEPGPGHRHRDPRLRLADATSET